MIAHFLISIRDPSYQSQTGGWKVFFCIVFQTQFYYCFWLLNISSAAFSISITNTSLLKKDNS